MTRWSRLAIAGGAIVLAVVLFVVLRPGEDGDDDEATPAAATTTAGEETTTEDTETTETTDATTTGGTTTDEDDEEDDLERVVVVVRNGQPEGGVARPEIEKDSRVLLVVRSDVADHLHLHGYDLLADVAPGQPGRIRFTADLTGRFEVELEDSGVLIAELEVS